MRKMHNFFFFRKIKNISALQKSRMLLIYEIKSYNTLDKIPKISSYDIKNYLKRYQLKKNISSITLFSKLLITITFLVEKTGITVFDEVSTIQ